MDINNGLAQLLIRSLAECSKIAIVSANKIGLSKEESRSLMKSLRFKIMGLNKRSTIVCSSWAEQQNEKEEDIIESQEYLFVIYDISLKQAIQLAAEYHQLSIVYKSGEKWLEMCSTEFTDNDNIQHNVNDIIREFNSIQNIQNFSEIIENREVVSSRCLLNSKNTLKLKEIYSVESPRASVFGSSERYMRIY